LQEYAIWSFPSEKNKQAANMVLFGDTFSKYYDLLYKDKNYTKEFRYIDKIIKSHTPLLHENMSILDIGCGTGKHLKLFKDAGYTVFGVDLSKDMLFEAQKNLHQEKNLICDSASNFNFNTKFDIVISLFHVMSYQIESEELEKVFRNVNKHLVNHGLFIFDFWYGPAVLSDPPIVRIKRLEDKEVAITRIAEPVMYYNDNCVDINFEMILEYKNTHIIDKIKETHKMRYLFLPEIKKLASDNNFLFIASYQWLGFSSLSEKSWYGLVILSK
jgi:SAM-dependent methyltransferase